VASQFDLLRQRRFAPLFWTQFLGAANDNIFKISFTGLVTYASARFDGVDPGTAAFLISAIFILPFLLFSATSGQVSDKFDKARVIRFAKSLEIVIMLIALAGFYFYSAPVLYLCTFLMGLQSTLFGPVKYAYLPQHLRDHELTGGNGMVETGTFVAILIGTIIGGLLAGLDEHGALITALLCLVVAIVGRVTAIWVPPTPSPEPDLRINWNPFTETWRNLCIAREKRAVFLSLIGISWLWFFGVTFLTSFFNFARDVLGGDAQVVTLLLAIFSIGIAIGSLLCERLSGEKVEIGLVPFGSIGMSLFAVDLYFASRGLTSGGITGVAGFVQHAQHALAHWRVMADLFFLAMFAGFYSVPLYALIQQRSSPAHRARIIAANNILNALFMIVASLMGLFLLQAGLSIPELFLVVAVLNAMVAVYIYTLVPEFLVRFLAWLLIHTFYRVDQSGSHRIPDEGPALLVCNHVSYVDAIVIMAESPRPLRFVMDHRIFKIPVLSFIFRSARAIPIAPAREDARLLDRACDEIAVALEAGELVCIFPEGQLTGSGEIQPFKAGVRRILDRTPVPVYPMALRGLWGSFFSRFRKDRLVTGEVLPPRPLRRGWLSRLELVVGAPVPGEAARPEQLQDIVAGLRGEWR